MTVRRTVPAKGAPMTRVAYIEKQASDDGRRLARFVASDESVDRYGDIIRASGWQLDSFRNNPVLLWGHRSSELPIGRVEPIGVEGTRLVAHAEFLPAGTTAFADSVWAMIDTGFLQAVSVGFMPLADPQPIFDADKHVTGFEFIAQELLELSVVPVPANPNALQLSRSFALTEAERQILFAAEPPSAAAIAAQLRRNSIATLRYRKAF